VAGAGSSPPTINRHASWVWGHSASTTSLPPQLTFVTISPGPWSLSWRIRPQLISEITVTLLDVMVTCDKYISQQQHWQQRSGSLGWLNLIFSMPIIKKFQKSTCEQTIQSLFLLPTLNTTASTFRPEHEDSHQGDEEAQQSTLKLLSFWLSEIFFRMNLKHVSLLQQTTKRRKGHNPYTSYHQITFHLVRGWIHQEKLKVRGMMYVPACRELIE